MDTYSVLILYPKNMTELQEADIQQSMDMIHDEEELHPPEEERMTPYYIIRPHQYVM